MQQLAIATISWARDKDEERLLRLALKQLSSFGIPLFITDGGSTEDFINYISQLNQFNVVRSKETGLWAQVKNSLQHAYNSGAPFIFYTEPDKLNFFKSLPQMFNDIDVNINTGIILATRSVAGMESFPSFQRMTEATINCCCAEVIKQDMDYTYGPFVVNRNIIPRLQALPNDIGWGWRPYVFNIAARMSLDVTAAEGDYFCPADQQEDDATERIYRMKQLIQSIQGLVLSAANDFQVLG